MTVLETVEPDLVRTPLLVIHYAPEDGDLARRADESVPKGAPHVVVDLGDAREDPK